MKLLYTFIDQIETALLKTSPEEKSICSHIHLVLSRYLALQPHLHAEEILNMKWRMVGQKVLAMYLEHQSSSRISLESGLFFKWGTVIQGCVGMMRAQSPDPGMVEGNTHARRGCPQIYQLLLLPSLILWNSVLPFCAFLFPQSPQFPQPTALPHSPPKPLLEEHMISLKTNSDAEVRGAPLQKWPHLYSFLGKLFKVEGDNSLGNNNQHEMPRNLSHFFALSGSSVNC